MLNPMHAKVDPDLPREAARAKLGHKYTDELFRKLVIYSADRLEGEMNKFFADHCESFRQPPGVTEHKLEWTTLHKQYEEILERHLEGFLKSEDLSMPDFLDLLKTPSDESDESSAIVDTVVASGDYEKFVSIMKRRLRMRSRK